MKEVEKLRHDVTSELEGLRALLDKMWNVLLQVKQDM